MSGRYLIMFRVPTGRRDVPNRLTAETVEAPTPDAAVSEIIRRHPDARNIRTPEPR
jgi:hypothetical protein